MILIVDQSREGREGVRRLLTRVGYRAECVGTAQEAIAYLRMVRPSAVIISEGGAGPEVLEALREDAKSSSVPVLIIGEGDDSTAGQEFGRLGACGYVNRSEADVIGLLSQLTRICEPTLPVVPAMPTGLG